MLCLSPAASWLALRLRCRRNPGWWSGPIKAASVAQSWMAWPAGRASPSPLRRLVRLRWRAPQPATPWTGVRDAIEYQHDCMQLPFPSDAAPLGTAPSEDCLYLNVWKPAQTTGRLPVLVWIYGGGWVNGGASPAMYSGANLAREGILVASFNYRIGRFGGSPIRSSPARTRTTDFVSTTARLIRSRHSSGSRRTLQRSAATRQRHRHG